MYQKMKDGIKIHLKIVPNSSKNEVVGIIKDEKNKDILKLKIAAIPEDGKANKELIKFLSKQWHVPASAISIISGEASRNKTILVARDITELLELLRI